MYLVWLPRSIIIKIKTYMHLLNRLLLHTSLMYLLPNASGWIQWQHLLEVLN